MCTISYVTEVPTGEGIEKETKRISEERMTKCSNLIVHEFTLLKSSRDTA
jgi:hypothetical protein